jgi:uncharacterized protein YqgV (UPF0045/DUF77 family)
MAKLTKETLTIGADAFLELVDAAAEAIAGPAAKRTSFAITLMKYRDQARTHKEVIDQMSS